MAGPVNERGRLCPTGINSVDILTDESRLTRPLVRRDGNLTPVSWETAYTRIADGFRSVMESAGADALAFLGAPQCTNEENYLLQKLARTLGTNNVDNRARRCHVSTARTLSNRLGWPATTSGLDDIGDADVVLVAGGNPAERQPIAFNSYIRPAVNDGTTLVHVDPVGNRTTRLADVHVAPRPGTDALVFDLLSASVVAADEIDASFVARRTRQSEQFLAEAAAFDRADARSITGVDREAVERTVGHIARADSVAAVVGTGIEGSDADASAPDSLLNLLLLTGNVGRRGTGVYLLRGLVNEQGATDAGCVPDRFPGHQPVTDASARARLTDEWGVSPPSTPGKTATELVSAFGDDIRAALAVGENPAIMKRERKWVRQRLEALDLLVVTDIVPSDTTPYADVVLPAAAGLEKSGTVTNLDRRIQQLRPVASPPGNARADLAILCELGQRVVDGDGLFAYRGVEAVFDELTRVAPTYAGFSFTDLGTTGCRWPPDRDSVLYRDGFETPDGRAPFSSMQPTAVLDCGDELQLISGGRARNACRDEPSTNGDLRMHPADAAERDIESGDSVTISNGNASVTATASLDEGVRRGTVYLHAAPADPLVRSAGSTVTVRSGSTDVPD